MFGHDNTLTIAKIYRNKFCLFVAACATVHTWFLSSNTLERTMRMASCPYRPAMPNVSYYDSNIKLVQPYKRPRWNALATLISCNLDYKIDNCCRKANWKNEPSGHWFLEAGKTIASVLRSFHLLACSIDNVIHSRSQSAQKCLLLRAGVHV